MDRQGLVQKPTPASPPAPRDRRAGVAGERPTVDVGAELRRVAGDPEMLEHALQASAYTERLRNEGRIV
jgi:hypothetical protein